jgi:hypothetical protein
MGFKCAVNGLQMGCKWAVKGLQTRFERASNGTKSLSYFNIRPQGRPPTGELVPFSG